MASVNFNNAATSALRNLQATNNQLDATQGRISTGLKIGEAKDNAAYWSISTTMKSDNKALSTVSDALGLGSATVDTAYQGLNSALDVLNEIKSKLTAASQDGVDKAAIQSEISELQNQLKSIASSSTFSGENWLSVNSGDASSYSATKQIVSSFQTGANGAVSLGMIDIDISSVSLTDASATGEGILDGGVSGDTSKGGLAAAVAGSGTAGTKGSQATNAALDYTGATAIAATDQVQLSLTIDGTAMTTGWVAAGAAPANYVTNLNLDSNFSAVATATQAAGVLTITSKSTGITSTVAVTGAAFRDNVGAAKTPTGAATFTTVATATGGADAFKAVGTFDTTKPIALDANDSVSFDVSVDGGGAARIVIDKTLVNSVLGTAAEGKITTAADYVKVLNSAFKTAGVDLTASQAANVITFTGGDASAEVSNLNASKGTNLLTFDITKSTSDDIGTYLSSVNQAIEQVTSAASTLGAVASRIDLQKTFVTTLMDTIDKGISGLVDADMNEESTKLQALQVKQQLGVQALSIANQSAQNVLSLFQ